MPKYLNSFLGCDVVVYFRTESGGLISHRGTLETVNKWHIKLQTCTKSGFHFKIPTKNVYSIRNGKSNKRG